MHACGNDMVGGLYAAMGLAQSIKTNKKVIQKQQQKKPSDDILGLERYWARTLGRAMGDGGGGGGGAAWQFSAFHEALPRVSI